MAKILDSKCKLCRREGTKLFLKGSRCLTPKCPIDKKGAVPPGQHGVRQARRPSEYSKQLREKQKAKRFYGVSERQFRIYFDRAFKKRGATGEALLQQLELRLDNVVYQSGLTASRSQARQLITHGGVTVDNRRVDIPSYQLKPGEVVSLAKPALKQETVKKNLAQKRDIPGWLQKKASFVKITKRPARDEVGSEIEDKLIVEYYSK